MLKTASRECDSDDSRCSADGRARPHPDATHPSIEPRPNRASGTRTVTSADQNRFQQPEASPLSPLSPHARKPSQRPPPHGMTRSTGPARLSMRHGPPPLPLFAALAAFSGEEGRVSPAAAPTRAAPLSGSCRILAAAVDRFSLASSALRVAFSSKLAATRFLLFASMARGFFCTFGVFLAWGAFLLAGG